MYLTQSELYAALGLAMQKIEAAGASTALTDAVVLVGEIRTAIGNEWNPAIPEAAEMVKRKIETL